MAHARQRTRQRSGKPEEIPMTPMIDVVFQLLIYFIVTFEPVDVMAHLDVFAPSPEAKQEKPEQPPNLIRIVIFPDGYTINDKPVALAQLDGFLSKLAAIDRNQTIMIQATAMSRHRNLIKVLDLCAKSGLNSLSVVSLN